MTFAQILLVSYLALSFIAAMIVYAACAMAGRQAKQSSTPQPPRLHLPHHALKSQLQPTARPALLQHESQHPIEHTPVTFHKN